MDARSYAVTRTAVVNSAPGCVLALSLVLFMLAKTFSGRERELARWPHVPELASSLFGLFGMFFITITDSAINTGLATLGHPNGERSLRAFPYILTTDDEASSIVSISLLGGIVWCFGGLVVVLAAMQMARTRNFDIWYRRCTLAVTIRYRKESAWWFLMILLQNFLLALTLSFFEDGAWQATYMGCIFALYAVALASFKPYFSPLVHYCDLSASVVRALFMVVIPMYSFSGQGEALVIIFAMLLYFPCIVFFSWSLYLLFNFKVKGIPVEVDKVCQDLGGRVTHTLFPDSSDLTEVARRAAGSAWVQHSKIRREVQQLSV